MNKKIFLFFFLLLFLITGCTSKDPDKGVVTIKKPIENTVVGDSFKVLDNAEICTKDGKPIIRKFATTWCPHCKWIKQTYTDVINEYVAQDKIVAYLWNFDIGDDALTVKKELVVPSFEKGIHQKFNPKSSIPTFVFGCKYVRIGNAFEQQNDLAAEAAEFRAIIDRLLEEVENE
tara:strand:+ start:2059 stop:2583 length:525 start_codon:yes stop_codon:yes gene_type:complete